MQELYSPVVAFLSISLLFCFAVDVPGEQMEEDEDDYEVIILVSHHTKLEYLKHNFAKPAVKSNLGKIADQLPQIFFDS